MQTMTLILTVNGPDTIWLLADRRFSAPGLAPKDDARKLMFLETTDGVALLGYAGLGATALGTEPSDWMSNVLRGRNLPLEQSLGVLAEAMKTQLPRHLARAPANVQPAHQLLVTAFLGDEARYYTIDLALESDRGSPRISYTRWVAGDSTPIPPTVAARTPRLRHGGSGGLYLSRDKTWARSLLRFVNAHDRGQISSQAVADHLATLNNQVHLGMTDKSVGPRCIVRGFSRASSLPE
jgi:hypothetical protein